MREHLVNARAAVYTAIEQMRAAVKESERREALAIQRIRLARASNTLTGIEEMLVSIIADCELLEESAARPVPVKEDE